jgi:hypothetical protein
MTMTASVESTPFDDAVARREGWVIAGCGIDNAGRRRVELQRLDDPGPGEGTFCDDGDAWKHVAEQARRGSPLHLQALALVDPIERALIEQHAAS